MHLRDGTVSQERRGPNIENDYVVSQRPGLTGPHKYRNLQAHVTANIELTLFGDCTITDGG